MIRRAGARMARALGYGAAASAARRVLGGELRREASVPVARIAAQLAVNATPDGSACGFYGAAFTELLRLLVGYEGAMVHVSCRATGGDRCEWRAAVPDPRHH
jgi:predicted hydrocarbon binding protein